MKGSDNLMDELNKIPTIFFSHFKVFNYFSGCPVVKGLSRHLGLKPSDNRLCLLTVCFLDCLLRCSLLTQYCLANSALLSVTQLVTCLALLSLKMI